MKIAGIIAEYNPLHSGHAWQIAATRSILGEDTAVVCVMSGHWAQGAGCAVADKWLRARLALMGGADLVLELPTLWAVSPAETFARGGAQLLAATGIVTHLSFGSEHGDAAALERVAAALDSPAYGAELRRFLDQGLPFAACRQAAVERLAGKETGELLSQPNNNLGVEYILALRRMHSPILPMTVLREGAGHGERAENLAAAGEVRHTSATDIRGMLLRGDWDGAAPYLVPGEAELLRGAQLPTEQSLAVFRRLVLSRLRVMSSADWALLPDSGAAEGLPDRLAKAGRKAQSLEEFYTLAKTKRYSHARLRRLALWAFLGLREKDRPVFPPYLRVLGANSRGREVLRAMDGRSALPVLTKPAHVRELDQTSRQVFEAEARCTDLYGFCLPTPFPGGREWKEGPVIL